MLNEICFLATFSNYGERPINEYYIYFLGDRMMEDSTKDLIQNEDVVLINGWFVTMSLLMHLFCSDHACLFLQLQFYLH